VRCANSTRRRVTLTLGLLACAVPLAVMTGGCGSKTRKDAVATPPPAQTVSIAELEARNRAARERALTARTKRLERLLAARRAAARRNASAPAKRNSTSPTQLTGVRIKEMPIPFGAQRMQEMAAYARRHYGIDSFKLNNPKVIVEHYTGSDTAQSAYNTFAPDVADPELHELPGVCSHFVIDRDGTVWRLVPLDVMCRHTVGLNYTAIGIEHAGFSDQQILSNAAQMKASLALTAQLRCRYGISIDNVIGHNESLSSPYHHELVPSLRTQTHGDWTKADMDLYRSRLPQTC
jgi:beta-N-acetylhexosaminidase